MSVQSVALASLAVTYSDSEGEDVDDEAKTLPSQAAAPHNYQSGQPQGIGSPKFAKSATNSPIVQTIENNLDCEHLVDKIMPKKAQGLVSYLDDSIVHHDGEVTIITDEVVGSKCEAALEQDELIADDLIPPEPQGQCSRQLQDKIGSLYKKIETGLDLNNVIKQRKDFKNPSIYEKLIQFCRINELGTNYSPEIFDPFKWGDESNYLELGKEQVAVMEKLAKKVKSKSQGMTSSVKRTSGGIVAETIEEKRKIGKWDQVTTGTTSTMTTTVTKSASATSDNKKCKVVIAFGAVQKKGGKIF